MTMAIILLHTFWSVLFFDGCENKRWWAVVAVISTHLLVSGLVSFLSLSLFQPLGMEMHRMPRIKVCHFIVYASLKSPPIFPHYIPPSPIINYFSNILCHFNYLRIPFVYEVLRFVLPS